MFGIASLKQENMEMFGIAFRKYGNVWECIVETTLTKTPCYAHLTLTQSQRYKRRQGRLAWSANCWRASSFAASACACKPESKAFDDVASSVAAP